MPNVVYTNGFGQERSAPMITTFFDDYHQYVVIREPEQNGLRILLVQEQQYDPKNDIRVVCIKADII